MTSDALVALIQGGGLWLLFPVAVLEGPIVTVIAGWLARLGYVSLVWAFVVLVAADLVGDGLFYALGRWGPSILPRRWIERLGLTPQRLAKVGAHFRRNGGRTLIAAKLTHSLGFAALAAAGAGRMPVAPFLWFNLLGTIPKTLAFLALGYLVGEAHATVGTWIGRVSLAVLVIAVAALGLWLWRRRSQRM